MAGAKTRFGEKALNLYHNVTTKCNSKNLLDFFTDPNVRLLWTIVMQNEFLDGKDIIPNARRKKQPLLTYYNLQNSMFEKY